MRDNQLIFITIISLNMVNYPMCIMCSMNKFAQNKSVFNANGLYIEEFLFRFGVCIWRWWNVIYHIFQIA